MSSNLLKLLMILRIIIMVKSQFIQPIPYEYGSGKYVWLTDHDISHNKINKGSIDMGMLKKSFVFNRMYDQLEDNLSLDFIFKTFLVYQFRALPILKSATKTYFCKRGHFYTKKNYLQKTKNILIRNETKEPFHNNWCYILNESMNQLDSFSIINEIKVEKNKTKFMVIVDVKQLNFDDPNGYYFFKTESPHGSYVTNVVEIRDILYWKERFRKPPSDKKMLYDKIIDLSAKSVSFDCIDRTSFKEAPKWAFDVDIGLKWYWCGLHDGITFKKCLLNPGPGNKGFQFAEDIDKVFHSVGYVSNLGKLTLINGDGISRQKIRNYWYDRFFLMCGYKSEPYRFVTGLKKNGLNWKNSKVNEKIIRISKRIQIVEVPFNQMGLELKVLYKAPKGLINYEWKVNSTKPDKSKFINKTPFILRFKQDYVLTNQDAGIYSLNVTAGKSNKMFVIQLKIIRPPMMINSQPKLLPDRSVYLMNNADFSIKIYFGYKPESYKLLINGIDPDLKGQDILEPGFKNRYLYFFEKNKDDIKFSYKLKNIKADPLKTNGQSHSIEVQTRNKLGLAKIQVNFIVLPKPVFKETPNQNNCSTKSCFHPKQSVILPCRYNWEYYQNVGVHVSTEWFINGSINVDESDYAKYFKIIKRGLIINQVSEPDINQALINVSITCRVVLMHSYKNESEQVYDSMTDRELMSQLTTKLIHEPRNDGQMIDASDTKTNLKLSIPDESTTIKVEMIEKKAATYSWLVFLIIGLILVILMILLITKFALSSRHLSRDEPTVERNILKDDFSSVSSLLSNENRSNKGSQIDALPSVTVTYTLNRESAPVICSNCSNGGSRHLLLPENASFRSLYPSDLLSVDCISLDSKKFDEQASFIGVYSPRSHKTVTTCNTSHTTNNNTQSLIDIVSNDNAVNRSQTSDHNVHNCDDNEAYTTNWLLSQKPHNSDPDPTASCSFKSIDNNDIV